VFQINPRYTLADRLHHTSDDLFRLVECRGCGLLRLDPRPDHATLSKYYPDRYWVSGQTRRGLAGVYRRLVLRDHLRFVRKTIKRTGLKRARVLDVGCGAGDLLAGLRARNHRGVGLDISAPALRSAAELGVPGARADYKSPPFADGSFDVVTMFHLLEHVPEPEAALQAAWKALVAGGCLVVQVPNADSLQFGLLGRYWSGLDVPRHLYNYRRQDLELMLERNGFLVQRRKFFSWRDNAPALATSLAPWLDPVARRVRRPNRAWPLRLMGDLLYFGLTLACLPAAIFEAILRRGATLMVAAEKVELPPAA
jgi:SAM-dependent methyltransferase